MSLDAEEDDQAINRPTVYAICGQCEAHYEPLYHAHCPVCQSTWTVPYGTYDLDELELE